MQKAKYKVSSGFIPFLRHLWVAVDRTLFLWNYRGDETRRLTVHTDSAILTCTVVPPRGGVFPPHVTFILVIVTENFVELKGLSVRRRDPSELVVPTTHEFGPLASPSSHPNDLSRTQTHTHTHTSGNRTVSHISPNSNTLRHTHTHTHTHTHARSVSGNASCACL
eukprot:GHVR01049600.1.p1 GENE.GHVR01049600.1~~GHVR01049600.1.p1  ORF type:complete len:193 (+),score=71.48 GHVR01049600.1:84-581(+)